MKKILFKYLKILKYLTIFIIVIFILFISAYHYTFVELVPEYTNEQFVKRQIGPYLIDLPEKFKIRSFVPVRIEYPNFEIHLSEHNYNIENHDNILSDKCSFSSHLEFYIDNEINSYDFSQNPNNYKYSLYIPKVSHPYGSELALKIYSIDGCLVLRSTVKEGETLEERLQIFQSRIDNFFQYYEPAETNEIRLDSFKTLRGFLKINADFHITTQVWLYDPYHTKYSTYGSISIFFNFVNLRLPKLDEWTFFNKLEEYISSRIEYNYIIKNYEWTVSQNTTSYLCSQFDDEIIVMRAGQNKIPIDLVLFLKIDNQKYNKNYNWARTDIVLAVLPIDKMVTTNYNVIYGYWLKILRSIC
jgi:hypothetical protein